MTIESVSYHRLSKKKKTIYNLAEFERAYALPRSSSKDSVKRCGFVAENAILVFFMSISKPRVDLSLQRFYFFYELFTIVIFVGS